MTALDWLRSFVTALVIVIAVWAMCVLLIIVSR